MACLSYREIPGDWLIPVQVLTAACLHGFISFVCMLQIIKAGTGLHSGNYLSFCKKEVLKPHFFSEYYINNRIFFKNSHCNSQLTELWSMCVFLTIWLFAFVHSWLFLFVSLLLNRKLYIENYFTWCLCSHQSLNCKMVSCTVLFSWLTASTSIKWFSLQWPEAHLIIFFPLNNSLNKTLKMKMRFIGYWLFLYKLLSFWT